MSTLQCLGIGSWVVLAPSVLVCIDSWVILLVLAPSILGSEERVVVAMVVVIALDWVLSGRSALAWGRVAWVTLASGGSGLFVSSCLRGRRISLGSGRGSKSYSCESRDILFSMENLLGSICVGGESATGFIYVFTREFP